MTRTDLARQLTDVLALTDAAGLLTSDPVSSLDQMVGNLRRLAVELEGWVSIGRLAWEREVGLDQPETASRPLAYVTEADRTAEKLRRNSGAAWRASGTVGRPASDGTAGFSRTVVADRLAREQ